MFKKLLAFVAAMYVAVAFAAVDANTATSAELDSIKGIGPVKSALIISERKKAPFKDWNDFVTRVKGVGTDSAAKFSAEGMTVNGASYKVGGKAEAKADKPVTEKAKDAAVATKDAVKGAAVATKDAAKETAKDIKAAVTPKAETKAEVKVDAKAGAKADAPKPASSAAKK
ncbi:helix-hairpin-helix domain-containing protein [Polaromonas sp.]|uniref:ComEA family DNA-binding protein n=1 Tax=Polaromonas sp. TaxID=1869339 RepID=UPI00272EF489|nr:helix-hairpin-helix domain-containing protein [Polaromonas sp.]MDP1739757.1 helix-hairpin-helix domain-containing protein [Polaromonas sp.]